MTSQDIKNFPIAPLIELASERLHSNEHLAIRVREAMKQLEEDLSSIETNNREIGSILSQITRLMGGTPEGSFNAIFRTGQWAKIVTDQERFFESIMTWFSQNCDTPFLTSTSLEPWTRNQVVGLVGTLKTKGLLQRVERGAYLPTPLAKHVLEEAQQMWETER